MDVARAGVARNHRVLRQTNPEWLLRSGNAGSQPGAPSSPAKLEMRPHRTGNQAAADSAAHRADTPAVDTPAEDIPGEDIPGEDNPAVVPPPSPWGFQKTPAVAGALPPGREDSRPAARRRPDQSESCPRREGTASAQGSSGGGSARGPGNKPAILIRASSAGNDARNETAAL